LARSLQQASSVPFSLVVDDELADNEEGVDLSAEDFVVFPINHALSGGRRNCQSVTVQPYLR
jgi:hypothetical protein